MERHLRNRTAAHVYGSRIPVDQLMKVIDAVSHLVADQLLAMDSIKFADGPDTGVYTVDTDHFRSDLDVMRSVCISATDKMGKMVIRFLGDLKEQTYPLDTILFNATKDDSHDLDLKDTIRSALLNSGGKEIRMVNLANVRDIVIVPGNADQGVGGKIKYLTEMLALFQKWVEDGDEIIVDKT